MSGAINFIDMICPSCEEELQKQSKLHRFMELPPPGKNGKEPFVLQHHFRGEGSVHWDFRFKVNSHLNGITILDNPKIEKFPTSKAEADEIARTADFKFKPVPGMEGKKCRAELKASQPLEWLKIQGKVPPGRVGATAHKPGFFNIIDRGTITFGAQKPYFHEYFLHGSKFKNLRVILRAIRLPRLDPETKEPIQGKYDLVWSIWIPKDQDPYAVSKRAQKENWFPPKNFIPIPDYWISKNKEKFEEWLKRAKAHWSGTKKLLKALAYYTLHEHKWIRLGRTGEPVGSRKLPQREWFLHLQIDGKPRTWRLEFNPLWAYPLAASYEGRTNKRWMDFEGTLEPGEAWNPNKKLKSRMVILAKGRVEVDASRESNREILKLSFKSGTMKGTWILSQEERGSEIYKLDKVFLHKARTQFVLQKHTWAGGHHFDIRVDKDSFLDEWSIPSDPLKLFREVEVNRKQIKDRSWLTTEGKKKIDGVMTEIKILDSGDVDIINDSPFFVSMRFYGKKLKGLYHLIQRNKKWFFGPSELPRTQKAIKIEEKPSRIIVHLHDIRFFSSCEPESKNKRYSVPEPPPGAKLRICAYPRPDRIHGVMIQSIIFPKPKFSLKQVQNMNFEKFMNWHGTQKRGKSESEEI